MKITFLNHASYFIEVDDVRMVCDPWLEGAAFNDGRNLLIETPVISFVHLFGPVKKHLFDLQKTVLFTWFDGMSFIEDDDADIRMHSDSLNYIYKFEWGFDTLLVNGWFHAEYAGFNRFIKSFTVSILNNLGKKYGIRLVFDTELISKFVRLWFSFSKKMRGNAVE